MGNAQLNRWLWVNGYASFANAIYYDPEEPFLGRQRSYTAEATLQPSSRLGESVSYNRVEFDRLGGSRVFTVDVLNTRTTFQLDRRFSLRAIVQYDSSLHRILTDFLASYEPRPGTVGYAGYGSLIERNEWNGTGWTNGVGSYRTTQRGFFFKASYIHRF
jgi:hypothetical protein